MEWGVPVQGGMRASGIVEVYPTLDGQLPGHGLTKGPGVQTLLVEGPVGAFDLAVLLGLSHRYQLVPDAQVVQGLLEGVGLLHVGEEDIGKLRTVVGLDFLDREREGPPDLV